MYGTCSGRRSLPLFWTPDPEFWLLVCLVRRPILLRVRNFSETRLTSGSLLLLCRPCENGVAKASKLEKRFSNFRLRRCKWSLRLPARVLRVLLRKSRNFYKNRVDQRKRKVRLNLSVESGGLADKASGVLLVFLGTSNWLNFVPVE